MAKKSERPRKDLQERGLVPQTPGVPEQTTDLNTLVTSLIRRMSTWEQACKASQQHWVGGINRGTIGVFKTDNGGLRLTPFSETLHLFKTNFLYTISYNFAFEFGMGELKISPQAGVLIDPENGEDIVELAVNLGGGATDPRGTKTLTVSETYSSASMIYTHQQVVYKKRPSDPTWTAERGEESKLSSVGEEPMTDTKAQQLFDIVDSILLVDNRELSTPKPDNDD